MHLYAHCKKVFTRRFGWKAIPLLKKEKEDESQLLSKSHIIENYLTSSIITYPPILSLS